MDDVARAAAEDGVVLVLAIHGEAPRAPLLEARELLVAEVPAPRALREVAAYRPGVANLRRADFLGGLHERGVLLRGLGVLDELDERDGRADAQPAVGRCRDRLVEVLHVHQPVGLGDVVFHQAEKVHPAGDRQDLAPLRAERGDRFLLRRSIDISKRFHSVPLAFSCSMAASTVSGVIGRFLTRAPVAFETALATAAAVEIVGGSPSPTTPRSG